MSYFWNLTKSFTKKFSDNSEYLSISTKNEKLYHTISTGRVTKTKSVSFKGVEIIDVESYKQYNVLEDIPLEGNEYGCMKRCGIFCRCNIV